MGPSPEAVSAIKKALSKINRYPEGSCFYLRQALSKKLKIKPGNLIFGNGSDEIIDIIIKTFSQPGDEILTSEVTFLEYKIIALQNGRLVTTAPMKDFRYDLAGQSRPGLPLRPGLFLLPILIILPELILTSRRWRILSPVCLKIYW